MIPLPESFSGVPRAVAYRHVYYKTRGMLLRSLWHKLWNWRRVDGFAFVHGAVEILYPELLTLGQYAVLGRGGKLNALSRHGVQIGRRVTLADGFWIQGTSSLADLGDRLAIGDHTYIGPRSVLGFHGPVHIGPGCAIGAHFQISAQSHDVAAGDMKAATVPSKGITIGQGCWIGNDVKVLDGVTIGERSVIGAGSVVTRSIPANTIAAGVPCRVLRSRP